jgi:hypothetical protein
VEGKDTTSLYAATDTSQSSTTTQSSSSLLGITLSDRTGTDSKAQSASIGTRLISTEKVQIGVGNKTELQGADVQAKDISFVNTNPNGAGELILGGSTDSTQTSHTQKDVTAGIYQEAKGQGSTTQTLNQTKLKGDVSFDAALKVSVQLPDTPGDQSLKAQINALVSQNKGAGLEYLNTLSQRTDIEWDKVALAHEKWRYDQAGLTQAGAALVSIAVAAATGGTGAAYTGTVGASGVAASAGFSALTAQAAVLLVNNKGDISKTLEQMGSEQSVKNILIAVGTAGVGEAASGQGTAAVAAQTAAGCLAGEMNGADCEQGAKTAAVLSSAGEAYRAWVGYSANAGPGENKFGFDQKTQTYKFISDKTSPNFGQQLPADHGMNVIGFNDPDRVGSFGAQGEFLSKTLNRIPFLNASAGLHDYIFNANPELNFTLWNVPTMLPAAVVSIPAALNNPNIYWLTQMKLSTVESKPPAPQSVIRIANPRPWGLVVPEDTK